MDRDALADFLVRHRAALAPADVGLGPGARRRTPGLRREEVAQLATMSTDYYTRLEQRRGPQPSTQMLAAIARALRMTPDERDYLFRVAGHSAPERFAVEGYVAPALMRVLDRLHDTPAMILSPLEEPLVQNDPARALFGDADLLSGWERSAIYSWFQDPEQARTVYPLEAHAHHSRARVASLRAAYGSMGPQSRAAELAELLHARNAEFAQLWDSQVVARRFEDHKVVLHPQVGRIEVDCQALLTEDASQVLLVLTAPPHSEDAGKLDLLATLGTQSVAGPPNWRTVSP
ncbi:helix-turn-helix transcriptional regulator [Brachybacterium fresconis]|uniref:Transcriptional regulator with XRE-family HTH domain n=1 Tax=Brachybacterium fresconis TaxID=173363 RepID=A0ABS4YGP0_9MICO|nr:helix-turn-helix transcriptional regulator [Brachybacterium fresconis]MBP2407914.1 transcriptional regulator with XRE-family HTH domain [Brachybacterium fresconis]